MRSGFGAADRAVIAAIVSELGRNILLFATHGEITIRLLEEPQRLGLFVAAHDSGPGIADVACALRDEYSTVGRAGIGLPGVRRLADEFEIASNPRTGTTVSVRKWRT
jgi:serine/threonine-protein kinase RsbT